MISNFLSLLRLCGSGVAKSWRGWITAGSPVRDDETMPPCCAREFVIPLQSDIPGAWSMVELEEVVAKLLDDPATEPIASEIGGASGLSHFCSIKNQLGKFYSPSTAMML